MPDALKTYQAKRDFTRTAEPASGGRAVPGAASFVIQKHWASRLHYDLRLELDGTMKSWAVPKGPSVDPAVKRMAVHVEDHPIAYNQFEGTIPEGQYGAGKVIIWDSGTWSPVGDAQAGYRKGDLKFELHGHKLRGRWVLVRMKGKDDKHEPWLLIKEKDGYARAEHEYSVVDEMPDSVRGVDAVPRAALPASLAPELATLVEAPPAHPEQWVFEVKFDGYRLLARVEGGQVQLFTRNDKDWTHKLQPVQAALLAMQLPDGWYDGEIVVHDAFGRPDFGLLQQAIDSAAAAHIVYFLFDLPYCDGQDLRSLPLEERRARLKALLEARRSPAVRFSGEFVSDPARLMEAACHMGLEGVIGKRRDSAYVSRRSGDWIKLKCGQRQEFVIGGYTDPQGSRTGLGALLLGYHDEGGLLRYAGNVGSGFDDTTLRALKSRLVGLSVEASPFADAIPGRKMHWVRPALVAEVRFSEWTRGGAVRHAVFEGLREDKQASQIRRERPAQVEESVETIPAKLKVTHGERVIDAASGTTKIELVRYYSLVGPLMRVHLKGRPVSLVRAPAGVGGQLFFQKHAEVDQLPGVKQLDQALDPEHPPMLEVPSVTGILSAAQWNVVEFHTQNAPASSYETPNRMVFDLDPGEGVKWQAMQEAAQLLHAFLDELGLPAFLKTSGGKGLHVVVPVKGDLGWDTVKDFSAAIVQHMADTIPDRFARKSGPRNRVGKIFIDFLRNGRGATTVCAWSARARPGLGISVPLDWDELATLKAADQWTVHNVHSRLDRGNAPWERYARSARTLTAAMKKLGFVPEAS